MTNQTKADVLGLCAVLCWSTVATAFKLSLQYLSPAQLLLIASVTSWLILFFILAWQGKLGLIRTFGRKDYRASLIFGSLNPVLYYLVLFQAYKLLPAQEAQALNYTWALTMALLAAPLLRHPLKIRDMLGALVCYSGVLVIASRGALGTIQFENLTGVLFALSSTVIWALYWIYNTRDHRDPLAGLFLNFTFAIPLLVAYCIVRGELSSVSWAGLMGGVYVGIFEMGISFVLWSHAMKLTDNTARISNLIFISPLLSLFLIAKVLDEAIMPSTIAGLALILMGLIVQRLIAPRRFKAD